MLVVQQGQSRVVSRLFQGGLFLFMALFWPVHPTAIQAQHATHATDPARFVDDLLSRMTLEEKLGQMTQTSYKDPDGASHEERILKEQVGSFLFVTDPVEINRLQHLAVEKTRLHIPLIFGYDVIHGFHTIFPIPLAMAASWNPAMVESAQTVAANEASESGVNWTFAPMVDIARDPRWGRIIEGAGEDPYLGSRMAEAQVRGFQGEQMGSPGHILACVKHFAGYGGVEGGRDYDQSNLSDEQLQNVYLPPFHAAEIAGAGSFMSAYMDLNGVPATGNRFLLHDVLRQDWGFKGFVVSDWDSVKSLTAHGFSADAQDAATRAVNAGVDMEMTSHVFRDHLAAAIKEGTVSTATVDEAVRDILMTKYRLGLFNHPYVSMDPVGPEAKAARREVARAAAEQSAVLLRNQNDTLPLKKTIQSIAIVGPLADSKPDTMGSWSLAGERDTVVTVLQGIRQKVGSQVAVRYAKGVEIERGSASIFDGQFPEPAPTLHTQPERDAAFLDAIDAIKHADVSVLVLGEANNMSGENASRSSLSLPGNQEQLLEAAVATGKPIILVLMNGRPLDIAWASQHVPAILEAWYPGSEGGNAIADLLFGDANPGGKLPITWPRSAGQIPIYYARNLTQNHADDEGRYWDAPNTPLYPFGFGLSYATFKTSPPHPDITVMNTAGVMHVSLTIENASEIAGDEVLQLYTHQRAGSASRPVRELKAFLRTHLGPGEKKEVTLELRAKELGFWSSATHHFAVEPGVFDLWIGTNSRAAAHSTFSITP